MLEKTWKQRDYDPELVQVLHDSGSNGNQIHKSYCKLFVARGILTSEEAERFINPTLEQIHDPFLMKGMSHAVKTISETIKQGNHIFVFGDYDVDGTTAVSLLATYLKKHLEGKVITYTPNREKEGYGISEAGINYAEDNDCSLFIALDCGIRAIKEVEIAQSKGMKVIICDHHIPGESLPNADVILNPKQENCTYPYKELSGCGIAFKLCQALAESLGKDQDEVLSFLDLVAISTACDIVEVKGENRVLLRLGLERISRNPSVGVRALKEVSGINGTVNTYDLGFKIGPRINASGRMESANEAVELLMETDFTRAKKLANRLNSLNLARKDAEGVILKEAVKQVIVKDKMNKLSSCIVYGEDWHKGVIGIVASKLVDEFYKPTIVFTLSQGLVTGSARSVQNFDVHSAIAHCAELLEKFGGHKYAAGLSLLPENLEAFERKFEDYVAQHLEDGSRIPFLEFDFEIGGNEISERFLKELMRFEPFGPGNPRPTFITRGMVNTGATRIVGEDHLKISVMAGKSQFQGIGFKLAERKVLLGQGPVDLCYTLEHNEWNGTKSIQLNIRDIRSSSQ